MERFFQCTVSEELGSDDFRRFRKVSVSRETLSEIRLARLQQSLRCRSPCILVRTSESDLLSPSTLHFLERHFASMQPPPTTAAEDPAERRQLRDINGNPVYRDKDDTRVMLSHIAEYTSWDTTKLYLTFPLLIWRMRSWLHQSMAMGIWTAPDPTIIVPSGKRNPLYWPKYEDEPRPEPE